jgi:benzoyl-CoA reductase subunit C
VESSAAVASARDIVAGGIVEAARRAGCPAYGCFPVWSPFELVHAAGALPLGLMGAGGQIEMVHADARFQSFVCSIAKSTLEMGLQKRLSSLEGAFFHSICDVARNLASVFRRNFPGMHVEYVHLAQNAASPEAEDYLTGEFRRLLRSLEDRLKTRVPDERVAASIAAYNRARTLGRRLDALRAREPERVGAAEAFALGRAASLLPPDRAESLYADALREFEGRRSRRMDRIKVIVEGAFCELPPPGLVDMLESSGCYVVDDDWVAGWRWFRDDVPVEGDPVRSLARAYLGLSRASSTRHDPARPRQKDLVKRVRDTGAQAVIFMPAKFCEPALFDYVVYRRELEREGIPHIMVEFEEKMWTFERTRGEIETFVESLLFD